MTKQELQESVMQTIKESISQVEDVEMLSELNHFVVDMIRAKRSSERQIGAVMAKSWIKPGVKVRMDMNKISGMDFGVGEVREIKRTRASVFFPSINKSYRIPLDALIKAG